MKNNFFFKQFSVLLILGWLVAFALLPFLLVFLTSFLKTSHLALLDYSLTFQNFIDLLQTGYVKVFLRSFWLSSLSAILCLLFGYPFAYILAKLSERVRMICLFLLILPFWTSSLIRIYATIIIIRINGLLNHVLLLLGIIHQPLQILYTQTAVLIGLVYALLPFMIFPLYANLERFDWNLLDAAYDLGASKFRTIFSIVIPNTIAGIVAGIILVLLPAMTMFYIPDILGGAKSLLLGNLIKDQFVVAENWPLGSAISVILTLVMALMIFIYWRVSSEQDRRRML